MLSEHIRLLMERSKFISRNVSATYLARGPQSGRGGHGTGGCGGGHNGGAAMLNYGWDKRLIANGEHEFSVHELKKN